MGKMQSKPSFTAVGIGRRKCREGPEGECFILNSTQHSEDEFSVSIPDLDKLSDVGKFPLQVVLPPEKGKMHRETQENINKIDKPLVINVKQLNDHANEESKLSDCEDKSKDNESSELNVTLDQCDGKLKHDDIARLVKRIHSTFGDAIPAGNKTINIKLTVSPMKKEAKTEINEKVKDCSPIFKDSPSSRRNKRTSDRTHFSDNHDYVSHSLNSSPASVFKCHNSIEKNLYRSHSSASPRMRKQKLAVEKQLHNIIEESMQKNFGHLNFGKSETKPQCSGCCSKSCSAKYKNRDNFPENSARRSHYNNLPGMEYHLCDCNDLTNCHSRQIPQRSHSHNSYDNQFQYKKLKNYSKSSIYQTLDCGLIHDPIVDGNNHLRSHSLNSQNDNYQLLNNSSSSNSHKKCSDFHQERHSGNSSSHHHHSKRHSAKVNFEDNSPHQECHRNHHRKPKSSHHVHEHIHHHYYHYPGL